jgi:hypothetical protein
VGARFQREEVMSGAGELEPFTGSPFWGQKASRRAKRRSSMVGRRSSVEQAAPAGEGQGGGAVPVWGE